MQYKIKKLVKEIDWKTTYSREFPNMILKAKKNQPCPNCGGKDRFHLRESFQEDGFYHCRQCGYGDGIDLLMKVHNCCHNHAFVICGKNFQENNIQTSKTNHIDFYINKLPQANENFEYLKQKGIKPTCQVKQDNNQLIIPKVNKLKNIVAYETISKLGVKKHYGSKEVCWHVINDQIEHNQEDVVFVEGYATGVSVFNHLFRNSKVIVCFGLTNIPKVVEVFRRSLPTKHFILCLDKDYKKNPLAKKLEGLKNCSIKYPKEENDFNDYFDARYKSGAQERYFDLKCTGYDVLDPELNKCLQMKIPSIRLTFENLDNGETVYAFFNCRRTGKKSYDYPVEKNSKLAQLYLNSGMPKPKRFNRGQHLAKQLIGFNFKANVKESGKFKKAFNLKFNQSDANLELIEKRNIEAQQRINQAKKKTKSGTSKEDTKTILIDNSDKNPKQLICSLIKSNAQDKVNKNDPFFIELSRIVQNEEIFEEYESGHHDPYAA